MDFLSADLTYLLGTFGYLAVFLLTLLGGQAVVPLAGWLAQQGILRPGPVALCAFGGSLLCNQGLFWLARLKGRQLLRRWPRLEKKQQGLLRLTRQHHTLLMICFPFLYGLRNISPFFFGLSDTSPRRFLPLNCLAASLWAGFFTALGYYLGQAIDPEAADFKSVEMAVMGGTLLLAALAWYMGHRLGPAED